MSTFRRRLLRIHGTILSLVALTNAVVTTYGWLTGSGLFGFMRRNPMAWVGLIQAYLLMLIIAVLLILGSGEPHTRKWHIVGALAHGAPLVASLSALDVFVMMGAGRLILIPLSFHILFLSLETMAALSRHSERALHAPA